MTCKKSNWGKKKDNAQCRSLVERKSLSAVHEDHGTHDGTESERDSVGIQCESTYVQGRLGPTGYQRSIPSSHLLCATRKYGVKAVSIATESRIFLSEFDRPTRIRLKSFHEKAG